MKPRVLCIVGSTGTGKSALAIALAQSWNGVIVNADSRQIYRDFPIITAQPPLEEQSVCPHELYGFMPTDTACAAGIWAEKAMALIREIHASGRLPILVGGTGFYIRALLHGIVSIPPVPAGISERLNRLFSEEGASSLHARLAAVDPSYASRIHPNDRQRLLRALAVFESTGHTFSWWHSRTPAPPELDALQIGLGMPLNELTPRLAMRVDAMLDAGALHEVQKARKNCDDPKAPGWSGIGCAELYQHVSGALSLENARELWIRNTRAYAKRQLTWFRADPAVQWFHPDSTDLAVRRAEAWLTCRHDPGMESDHTSSF